MIFNWRSDSRIIKPVFLWLSGIATDKDAILVDFSGRNKIFYFDFPLRYGDKPKKASTLSAAREITFIIRKPENAKFIEEAEWIKIFSLPEWEIFEKRTRQFRIPPLRWGLNNREKTVALKIARDALEKFLTDGQRLERAYFSGLFPCFYFKTCLDVAIWVRGQLRGSKVVENFNLGEGIAEAAILASRDSRFKPLSKEELWVARIEITMICEPRLPLTSFELQKNIIYPNKGYLLEYNPVHRYSNVLKNIRITGNERENREKKGWFLPEVFNARRFSSLEEFLAELGHEKAGLARDSYKNSEIFTFEVDDFIESKDHREHLSLWGPIVVPSTNNESSPNLRIRRFETNSLFVDKCLRAAADWLCRIQEPDGNIPPIINPLTGKQTQIDWPRLAFSGWSLAEFGNAVYEEKYCKTAEKTFVYLKQYLFDDRSTRGVSFQIPHYEVTLAYFGHLAHSLREYRDALAVGVKILERLNEMSFEPIAFSQITGIFKKLAKTNLNFSNLFETLSATLKENFEKELENGESVNLALWAELVNVFFDIDTAFSDRVTEWFKKYQLPNGAFSESTASGFVYTPTPNLVLGYTRGTGKIFEVLALEPEKNKEEIEKTLDWLLSMQYDEENTFFVPEEIRQSIIGGFRHDYFNQEAWIDTAGHLLLGGARLTAQEK